MKFYEKVLLGAVSTAGTGVVAAKTLFPWIQHDLRQINVESRMSKFQEKEMQSFLIDKFEKHVQDTPKKPFIIYEDNIYTFELVDQQACKVANIAKGWGLGPRDCVAIMIQNEPSFIWTFLGLLKLGIAVAFINHNLRMHPLIHSILAAEPKYLIVGPGDAILEAVINVVDSLGNLNVFVQGLGSRPAPNGLHSFDPLMSAALPSAVCPAVRKNVTLQDICCYVYTSGTTGNPKPAIISHKKNVAAGCLYQVVELVKSDILYIVLPLYHSAGGRIGQCGALTTGATIVLRKKFSAHHFWSDINRYNVTVVSYIGEIFRYLLAQPPSSLERTHKVRAAFGNGLRKDIFEKVQKRFKIPIIVELFGATEGVRTIFNLANKPGAVGRLSPLLRRIESNPIALVKFDYSLAEPIRDKNGFCIHVGIGEPGLIMAKVPDALVKNGSITFYLSSKESNEKKLVRDAFTKGDLWFNYGDVLILDKDYFLYFNDRIGDTFRWKSENVSTIEVGNVMTALKFIEDANVYGVTIPGHDGRAGMAAITLTIGATLGEKELDKLYEHVCEELPTYARPIFLRHLQKAILTGTFKQRKVELVNEGFDLNLVKDDLYFLNHEKKTYSKLTPADLSKLLASKL